MMDKTFAKQTVIISGGIGDIGFATATEFARQGASIALGDIHPPQQVSRFVNELRAYGVPGIYQQVDVSDAAAVGKWIGSVEKEIGAPTIIIPNAAIATQAGIHAITPEQWSRELRVNLDGAFFLAQQTTARLVTLGLPGRVVFVGSWAGEKVHPHIPAYSVSKAGLTMLCKCLALELAPHDILVNEIAPGYVTAGLSGRVWKENPGEMERSVQKVPIKKVITAKEVAEQILYLSSPQNRHMTGATLLMDGGLSLL